jgi:hypothetical protein
LDAAAPPPGLLSCTRDHVALVACEQADTARRQAAPLDLLRQYLRQNLEAFVDLRRGGIRNTAKHDRRACPGYVYQHADNGLEYLFSDRRFEQVVGGAAAARRLKADLAEHGMLATATTTTTATAAGTGSDRYSSRRTIGKAVDGKGHREQVIAVRAAAFE